MRQVKLQFIKQTENNIQKDNRESDRQTEKYNIKAKNNIQQESSRADPETETEKSRQRKRQQSQVRRIMETAKDTISEQTIGKRAKT